MILKSTESPFGSENKKQRLYTTEGMRLGSDYGLQINKKISHNRQISHMVLPFA
jgi:hypothetical protein